MKSGMKSTIIKCIVFLLIGAVLFAGINRMFTPRWNYPVFAGNATDTVATFYAQDKNTDDVIFFGTSHVECGISPMEIYKTYGISSYNLATRGQPPAVSYYLLVDAVKTQKPQVVMMDVSGMFRNNDDALWRYALDPMPMSINKIKMAGSYAEISEESTFHRFISVLFPIYQYHDWWNNLTNVWSNNHTDKDYVTAGYWFYSTNLPMEASLEDIDAQVDRLSADSNAWTETITNGEYNKSEEESIVYNETIGEDNIEWLKKINNLCINNNIELCLIKVPAAQYVTVYSTAWNKQKSEEISKLAAELNVPFYDFQYNGAVNIDNAKDWSMDYGHLNYNGAVKVSDALAECLINDFGIEKRVNTKYDRNMPKYDSLAACTEVELAANMVEYASVISSYGDRFITIVAGNDDISEIVDDTTVSALNKLGIGNDFVPGIEKGNAYLAIIDGGKIAYESKSNRFCHYEGDIQNVNINATCNGADLSGGMQLNVNGTSYSKNVKGLNIVVIDKESGVPIDYSVVTRVDDVNKLDHYDLFSMLYNYWFGL